MDSDDQLWLDNEVIKEAIDKIRQAHEEGNFSTATALRHKLYVEFLDLIAYDSIFGTPTWLQDMAKIVLQAEKCR